MLVLENDDHHGKIHLDKGTVIHAEIDELRLGALKSAYRMLEWTRGSFELLAASEKAVEKPISAAVQEILMDGLTQLDELRAMQQNWPKIKFHALREHAGLVFHKQLDA